MRAAAAVLVLLFSASVRGDEPALQLLIARADGTHAAAKLPLSGDELRGAEHLWAWSDRHAPRKLKPMTDGAQIAAELGRSQSRALDVRVRGWSRAEELASLRVIAAPAEMWESVPEPFLPAFPVSKEGRVTLAVRDPMRVRIVGDGVGTLWEPVGRSAKAIDVALRRPVADAELKLLAHDGTPVRRAFATVMYTRRGEAQPRFQAQFAADDRGTIRIPSLPEAEVLALMLIGGDGAEPRMLSGTAAELTRELRLQRGGQLRGRFVDEENRPLPGVSVEAEGWISPDAPAASRGEAVSDESGQWAVGNLPGRDVIVRASMKGRATFRKRVKLDGGKVDLGVVPLLPSPDVTIAVVDTDEQPLAGVSVTTDSGFEGKTNKAGVVALTGLLADEATAITVAAKGFVKRTVSLAPPLPKEEQVVLERAFSIAGKLVTDDGTPVSNAIAVITAGTSYRRLHVDPDGSFDFDADVGKELELTFESPSAAMVTRKESAGRAGERRDLGTIRLPSGLSIRGRVVDSAELPVAGARVWAVRPSAGGTVVTWAAGRIVQATSDADGTFDLRGLPPGPVLLRIDAADHARAWRNAVAEAAPVDLGAIALVRGRTVTVKARRDVAATARLDLRGEWLDADMLTAPVVDGEARLRNVPPGQFKVTVANAHAVLCERRVDVLENTDAAVECPPPMLVRGRVLLGGTPAFAGTLTWMRPSETDALIDTRLSPLGVMQQRLYGISGGTVVVPLRSDGTFETDELRPGEWQVAWRSTESGGTPDRPFAIPDVAEANVVVEFSGGTIRGRVVDERHQPVASARVREIQGPLFAMSAADGSFTMTAVAAGAHRLQAALGSKSSRVLEVTVEPDQPASDVTLQLDDAAKNPLTIRVVGIDGEPQPHAFVFVEALGGIIKTLTADANGVADVTFPEGLPDGARLVAYAGNAWAFARFRRAGGEGEPQNATIRFARTGTLKVRSKTVSGAPALLASWAPGDLGWMLGRIGTFLSLSPEAPLEIHGLPAGMYEVRIGADAATAAVTAGSTAAIDLR
ncbi:MAG TPA: carboxypeptidase regulatory-like domain-containing protein [Thermoanaerobaculia bacterium]|nr:carboxypeptidase regulatory-like domain-containing protein [Thermoanaerobaculia bacterium]